MSLEIQPSNMLLMTLRTLLLISSGVVYIQGNVYPQATKTSAVVDLDFIEKHKATLLALKDYVSVNDTTQYQFHLDKVTARFYDRNERKITSKIYPEPCTRSTKYINLPRGFFCINKTDGRIYTTKAIIGKILADEEFTVRIKVFAEKLSPVQITYLDINITFSSVCKESLIHGRTLYMAHCADRSSITASYPNNLKFYGNPFLPEMEIPFRINLNSPKKYFIFGITSSIQNKGLPLMFQVRTNISSKLHIAKMEFKGRLYPFAEPFPYENAADYRLLVFVNGTKYNLKEGGFKLVKFSLIEQKDYCSNKVCVSLYQTYESSWRKDIELKKGVCVYFDVGGFNAKYGYCRSNFTIKYFEPSYLLDLTTDAGGEEIIPKHKLIYASSGIPLRFKVLDVKWENGTVAASHEPAIKSFVAPKPCTTKYNQEPKSFFCVNENTGHIYMTSDLHAQVKSGRVSENMKFIFNIKISMTKYPYLENTTQVTLIIKDICAPTKLIYAGFRNFIHYKIVEMADSVDPHVLEFNLNTSSQLTLMTINSNAFEPPLSNFYIRVLEAKDKTLLTPYLNGSLLKDSYKIKINLPPEYRGKLALQIGIYDKVYKTGPKLLSYGRIKYDNRNTFSMSTVDEFNCTEESVDEYSRWKKSSNDSVCLEDPESYGEYFEVCINPNIKISSKPAILNYKDPATGKDLILGNCKYSSNFQVRKLYWLKDDKDMLMAPPSHSTLKNKAYDFPDLLIKYTRLADQGEYQCVVEYRGTKYKSEKLYLIFTDVSRFKMNMTVSDDSLVDGTNHIFKSKLKAQVEQRIKSVYKESTDVEAVIDKMFVNPSRTNEAGVEMSVSLAGIERRDEVCQTFSSVFITGQLSTMNIENVATFSMDCCPAEKVGEENFKGVYEYDAKLVSTLPTVKSCTYNENQTFSRFCFAGLFNIPQWSAMNLTVCDTKTETTKELLAIHEVNITASNAAEVSGKLKETVANGTLTNTVDILLVTTLVEEIVEVMNNVATNESETDAIAENVLDVADGVLNTDRNIVVETNMKRKTSVSLLKNLDTMAVRLANHPRLAQKKFKRRNLALTIENRTNSFTFIVKDKGQVLEIETADGETTSQVSLAKLFVPRSLLSRAHDIHIYSYAYRSGLLFLQDFESEAVQSIVMAATVPKQKLRNLTDPVVIILKDQSFNGLKVGNKSTCQFWLPRREVWSRDGCTTLPSTYKGTVRCECTHLTNFALLLDVDQTGVNPLGLKIVTWIGCGVSIFALLLTVITFTFFGNLRRKLPAKILLCLSCSLLALLVTFLLGAERTKSRLVCQSIAALIQYFLLSTFFWMSVEGFNLYRNFVKVFSSGAGQKRFMVKSFIYASGVPLVITALTVWRAADFLGPEENTDLHICVIRGLPFFVGVVLPAACVLIQNFIVLVLVTLAILDRKENRSQRRENLASVRIAFACSVLLGTTWAFGIVAVGDLRDMFQWIFCIFNSLQGFFIFIFYAVRNAEVRRTWKKFFGLTEFERSLTGFGRTKTRYLNSSGCIDSMDKSVASNDIPFQYIQPNVTSTRL